MNLSALMASALEGAFSPDKFGEHVIYTAGGGLTRDILAIVSYGEDLEEAQRTTALEAAATIWIREADIPEPRYQDTITIAGRVWTVLKKLTHSAGIWELALSSDTRPALGRR